MQRTIPSLMRSASSAAITAGILAISACTTVEKSSMPAETGLPRRQRVLSGMLALVEAQHTYYAHVMHGTRFADDMSELGSRDEAGGTVMVMEVWNANAEALKAPMAGYCFKVLPYFNGPGKKDGFAVAAFAAQEAAGAAVLPVFLTLVKSGRGGLLSMTVTDTWEVRDADLTRRLRAALRGNSRLDDAAVSVYAPAPYNHTRTLRNFSTDSLL